MKNRLSFGKLSTLILFASIALSFTSSESEVRYKTMIQMINYTGEGAYVSISLMKPDGGYDKTLYIAGKDSDWYDDLKKWWGFQKSSKDKLDGITGSSIAGGQRSVALIKVPSAKINKGYKLRFESAVEEQKYHEKDVEFELKTENINTKIEGKGFIRYVRLIPA